MQALTRRLVAALTPTENEVKVKTVLKDSMTIPVLTCSAGRGEHLPRSQSSNQRSDSFCWRAAGEGSFVRGGIHSSLFWIVKPRLIW